jgi:hypothetical protein
MNTNAHKSFPATKERKELELLPHRLFERMAAKLAFKGKKLYFFPLNFSRKAD